MSPPTQSRRTASAAAPRRWLAWGGGVATLLLVGWAAYFLTQRAPLLPVARPAQSATLDPQVRAYVEHMASLVEADPRHPAKRATLGLAYAANELWAEARQTFLDAARLDPDQPLAPLYAAVAREELGDLAGAMPEFRLLTEQYPAFAPGWYRLGDSALRTGDLPLAETAFNNLVRLAPTEWRGPAGLGEVRLRQGQPNEAIRWLEQARGLDPAARGGVYLLGQAYRAVGRTNEARLAVALGGNDFRQPMPDPWSEQAPRHMRRLPDQLAQAEELANQGRPDLGVALLQQAHQFHPNHPGLTVQLAVALNRAGQPAQALPLLDRVLQSDPKSIAARIARSHALAQLGQGQAALTEAQAATALDPKLAQAHLAVANALLAREMDQEAVESLRTAAACDPRNGEIQLEIGTVLWRNLADPAGAHAHFLQAVELAPALPRAMVQLGLLQLALGQRGAARESLARLQSMAPGSPETAELADALRQP
jgi:eukaryotic-like serine/threonine-protein kinase